ncbi:MAG: hypothetical protein ACTHQQ_06905 [Solirubrobacteraceae bacterium]
MPRSRGMVVGLCLVVLGIWGAIIPFVGPYFHYAFINLHKWHFTHGRLWLDIIPGAATFFAGLLLLGAANRGTALFAGWMAAVAGAWYVVGPQIGRFWNHAAVQAGHPYGGQTRQALEQLGYFYALGGAILLLAGIAIGRASVVTARDVLMVEGVGRRSRRSARRATPVGPSAVGDDALPIRSVGPRRPISREPATTTYTPPPEGPGPGGGDPSA